MQTSFISVNYKNIKSFVSKKELIGSVSNFVDGYLEDEKKINIDTDLHGYQNQVQKMLDPKLVDVEKYWFSSSDKKMTSKKFMYIYKQQLNENESTNFYYGVVSFTPEMLSDIGINRDNLKVKDIDFIKSLVGDVTDVIGRDYLNDK